jgi:hypothetical protein
VKHAIFALLPVTLIGCVSSYQSAKVLAPGQTQITGALTRSAPDDQLDEGLYTGDIQVRHGLSDKVDGGVRYGIASEFGSIHSLSVDAKIELVPDHVSVSLPVGVIISDEERDFEYGGFFIAPTVLLGAEMSKNVALVAAPRLIIAFPDEDDGFPSDSTTLYGASVGVRFSADLERWAIHPEVGLLSGDDLDGTLISAGVGVSTTY